MDDPLSLTFAALADPTRRAILARIGNGGATVNDIVASHGLSQPAISKHIKVLERAGLVRRARDSRTRPVLPDPEGLSRVRRYVEDWRVHWLEAFDRMDGLLAEMKEAGDDRG